MVNPNFAAPAEAVGIKGFRVESSEALRDTLAAALAHPGPVLMDARVNRQELSIPPAISFDQAIGFNLYSLHAILSGRGDEIIDLAKTNLRQAATLI